MNIHVLFLCRKGAEMKRKGVLQMACTLKRSDLHQEHGVVLLESRYPVFACARPAPMEALTPSRR